MPYILTSQKSLSVVNRASPINKLKQLGNKWLLTNDLNDRFITIRVIFNFFQATECFNEVIQGLGPGFPHLLIYINDLPQ